MLFGCVALLDCRAAVPFAMTAEGTVFGFGFGFAIVVILILPLPSS